MEKSFLAFSAEAGKRLRPFDKGPSISRPTRAHPIRESLQLVLLTPMLGHAYRMGQISTCDLGKTERLGWLDPPIQFKSSGSFFIAEAGYMYELDGD